MVGVAEAGEDLGEAVVAQAHFDFLEGGDFVDDSLDKGAPGFAVELDVAVGDEQDVVDLGGGYDGGGAHAGAQLGVGGFGHDFDFVGDDAADVAGGGRDFGDLAGDVGVGQGVKTEPDGLADLDLADVDFVDEDGHVEADEVGEDDGGEGAGAVEFALAQVDLADDAVDGGIEHGVVEGDFGLLFAELGLADLGAGDFEVFGVGALR